MPQVQSLLMRLTHYAHGEDLKVNMRHQGELNLNS